MKVAYINRNKLIYDDKKQHEYQNDIIFMMLLGPFAIFYFLIKYIIKKHKQWKNKQILNSQNRHGIRNPAHK